MSKLFNFLGFQALWFCCVLGAARGLPWLGPAALLPLAALHLWSCSDRASEARLLLLAAMVGYLLDSFLVIHGTLLFAGHTQLLGPSPLWMVVLWVGLAGTLRSSLGWMRGRYGLAVLFGGFGGPLAYLAGSRLGALSLAPPEFGSVALIATEWVIAMPLLVHWAGTSESPVGAASLSSTSSPPKE